MVNLFSGVWGLVLLLPLLVGFCFSLYLFLSMPHHKWTPTHKEGTTDSRHLSSVTEPSTLKKLQNLELRLGNCEQTLHQSGFSLKTGSGKKKPGEGSLTNDTQIPDARLRT